MSLTAGRPSRNSKASPTIADMSDKAGKVRINFDVDRDLHTKLKIYAIQQGQSIREVLETYIKTLI